MAHNKFQMSEPNLRAQDSLNLHWFHKPTVFQRHLSRARFLSILSLLEIDRKSHAEHSHFQWVEVFFSARKPMNFPATIWFAYTSEWVNCLVCVYLCQMLAMLQIEVDGLNELICSRSIARSQNEVQQKPQRPSGSKQKIQINGKINNKPEMWISRNGNYLLHESKEMKL